jgi:hypothetical protein
MTERSLKFPRYQQWHRVQFLASRHEQHRAHMTSWIARGRPATEIIVECEDEIACDACNATIDTPYIHVVRHGFWAVCDACVENYR